MKPNGAKRVSIVQHNGMQWVFVIDLDDCLWKAAADREGKGEWVLMAQPRKRRRPRK